MNFVFDILNKKSNYHVSVFTTKNTTSYLDFNIDGTSIWRLGSISKNVFIRYLSYVYYNLVGSIILFIKRPDIVVVYETLSVLPIFTYSLFFKRTKIHVHFHEYMSATEKSAASFYVKFLLKLEKRLFKIATISHTNKFRRALFLNDCSCVSQEKVFVYPNLPPASWLNEINKEDARNLNYGKIRLVYVGALDSDTMYLEEVLKWVKKNLNSMELTLFSQQYSQRTKLLIEQYCAANIHFKPAVNYYDLPKELIQYDIGLVLYTGHIPNYIYNIPNKVYEYLSCGLWVLADQLLIGLTELKSNRVRVVNFKNLDSIDFTEFHFNELENPINVMSDSKLIDQL